MWGENFDQEVIAPRPPASANYRDGTDEKKCGTCIHFLAGVCHVYDASASSGMVCDEWDDEELTEDEAKRLMEDPSDPDGDDRDEDEDPDGIGLSDEHVVLTEIYDDHPLQLSEADEDGVIWGEIIKTGTWALSPDPARKGPVERPIIVQLESDKPGVVSLKTLVDNFNAGVVENVTIPLSHSNTVLENTGFVKQLKIAPDPERPGEYSLMGGFDFREPEVKDKVKKGLIAGRSMGVFFNHRDKKTGQTFNQVLDHVALTNRPWITGLKPFGMALSDDVSVTSLMLYNDAPLGKPGNKKNWVDKVGGLPKYVRAVARALHEKRGFPMQRAIATAISRIKYWGSASKGATPKTRTKAAKATAEWEAKKARSHTMTAARRLNASDLPDRAALLLSQGLRESTSELMLSVTKSSNKIGNPYHGKGGKFTSKFKAIPKSIDGPWLAKYLPGATDQQLDQIEAQLRNTPSATARLGLVQRERQSRKLGAIAPPKTGQKPKTGADFPDVADPQELASWSDGDLKAYKQHVQNRIKALEGWQTGDDAGKAKRKEAGLVTQRKNLKHIEDIQGGAQPTRDASPKGLEKAAAKARPSSSPYDETLAPKAEDSTETEIGKAMGRSMGQPKQKPAQSKPDIGAGLRKLSDAELASVFNHAQRDPQLRPTADAARVEIKRRHPDAVPEDFGRSQGSKKAGGRMAEAKRQADADAARTTLPSEVGSDINDAEAAAARVPVGPDAITRSRFLNAMAQSGDHDLYKGNDWYDRIATGKATSDDWQTALGVIDESLSNDMFEAGDRARYAAVKGEIKHLLASGGVKPAPKSPGPTKGNVQDLLDYLSDGGYFDDYAGIQAGRGIGDPETLKKVLGNLSDFNPAHADAIAKEVKALAGRFEASDAKHREEFFDSYRKDAVSFDQAKKGKIVLLKNAEGVENLPFKVTGKWGGRLYGYTVGDRGMHYEDGVTPDEVADPRARKFAPGEVSSRVGNLPKGKPFSHDVPGESDMAAMRKIRVDQRIKNAERQKPEPKEELKAAQAKRQTAAGAPGTEPVKVPSQHKLAKGWLDENISKVSDAQLKQIDEWVPAGRSSRRKIVDAELKRRTDAAYSAEAIKPPQTSSSDWEFDDLPPGFPHQLDPDTGVDRWLDQADGGGWAYAGNEYETIFARPNKNGGLDFVYYQDGYFTSSEKGAPEAEFWNTPDWDPDTREELQQDLTRMNGLRVVKPIDPPQARSALSKDPRVSGPKEAVRISSTTPDATPDQIEAARRSGRLSRFSAAGKPEGVTMSDGDYLELLRKPIGQLDESEVDIRMKAVASAMSRLTPSADKPRARLEAQQRMLRRRADTLGRRAEKAKTAAPRSPARPASAASSGDLKIPPASRLPAEWLRTNLSQLSDEQLQEVDRRITVGGTRKNLVNNEMTRRKMHRP